MKKSESKTKPRSGHACKFCGKPTEKKGDFCSPECEIAFLKGELSKRNGRKDSEPRCYGRVEWGTCVQELYTTTSYDAKKRTSDLRKLGFICEAKSIASVPVFSAEHKKIVNEQMTLLTCFNKGKKGDEQPPLPNLWDPGLGTGDVVMRGEDS